MNGRRIGQFLTMVMVAILIVTTTSACASTTRLRRDLDTTGSTLRISYISSGSASEGQGALVYNTTGMPIARTTYENSGGSSMENLEFFDAETSVWKNVTSMVRHDTKEDLYRIRGAANIIQRMTITDRDDLVVPASKLKFGFMFGLNNINEQNFELVCLYQAIVPEGQDFSGEKVIKESKAWFAKLTYTTDLDKKWNPYHVNLKNAAACSRLPANWAQMNETYDTAIELARSLVRDLKGHNWEGLSEDQGQLYKVVGNPTQVLDILGFESTFSGWAIDKAGKRYNYRIRPIYKIFPDGSPELGWAKQNSRNNTLQALELDIEVGGNYQPKAVMFFVKSWWAKNSLYGVKRLSPGESPRSVVEQIFKLMDVKVPADIQSAYDAGDIEKVIGWLNTQPQFTLKNVPADYAAVVDVVSTSETLYGTDSKGGTTTVQGPRRLKSTQHPYGDPMAVDYFLTFLGEHAVELLDLGYIQPGGGDGFGYIAGILNVVNHLKAGTATFDDAARLNQRAPESPEAVQAALDYFLGQ